VTPSLRCSPPAGIQFCLLYNLAGAIVSWALGTFSFTDGKGCPLTSGVSLAHATILRSLASVASIGRMGEHCTVGKLRKGKGTPFLDPPSV